MAKDMARLLSEANALRQLHQNHADALSVLHDRIDGMRTHLGDVALAHLSVTDTLRDHLDLRLELVGDTALATLGEVAQLRAVQDGADVSPGDSHMASGASVSDAVSDTPVTGNDDALSLPPRDRSAMLFLSSFFQHSVQ